MIPFLLILIPLVAGFITFFLRNEAMVKTWVKFASFTVVGVAIWGVVSSISSQLVYDASWMNILGSRFSIQLDGMGKLLCLLTAISFPIIIISADKHSYNRPANFYGLILLSMAGLMGVFVAMDALLFYFFWELALIPVYFLCSQWGGTNRVQATFKFFIYTFTGSILMLIGILYIQSLTADGSFAWQAFTSVKMDSGKQTWMFWLFFIAFAIKIPVFPFHTWQPDLYEESNTPTTMILSGVMVKMGIFGLLRWVLPVMSIASYSWGDVASSLAIISMLYASIMAMQQDDLKRLVAYSSIAHLGLMVLAVFSETHLSVQGTLLQMFNHGINIIGLWVIVDIIEKKFGTRKMSELGGVAQKAPVLSIFFVIIALANIALPLTNGFVGEFIMFTGIATSKVSMYTWLYVVLAGLCIILAAVYTLNMLRKVLYGNVNAVTENGTDITLSEKMVLASVVLLVLWVGVYSQPMLSITNEFTGELLKKADVLHLIKK